MKKIALTFDDGPNEFTDEILNILKNYGVKSTFFIWGELENTHKAVMLKIVDEGHQLANHTFTHPDLTKLDDASIEEELRKTDDVIQKYSGTVPHLFRPPYGSINENVERVIDKEIILWSLDSKDWSGISADEIERNVVDNVKENDLVLLHSIEQTVNALPKILESLIHKSFDFVFIEEIA